jgi:hypothetical protein
MQEPEVKNPIQPANITAPKIETSGESVKLAEMVQEGVNKGFEHVNNFEKMYKALAIKKQEKAFSDMSWRYNDKIAKAINDMQYGGKQYKDFSELITDVNNNFNDEISQLYNTEFVAKWEKSQEGLKTRATGTTLLGGSYMKVEYNKMSQDVDEKGDFYALAAFTGKMTFEEAETAFSQYMDKTTILTPADRAKKKETFKSVYENGKVRQDLEDNAEWTVGQLESNNEYMSSIKPAQRQELIKIGKAILEGNKAAGKNNKLQQYYLSLFMDDNDALGNIVDLQIEAQNDDVARGNLFKFAVAKRMYKDDEKGKAQFLKDLNNSSKFFTDNIQHPDNIAHIAEAQNAIRDLSLVISKLTDRFSSYDKSFDETALNEFKKNIVGNIDDFVEAVSTYEQTDFGAFKYYVGKKEYQKMTKGMNSAVSAFFDILQNPTSDEHQSLEKTAYGSAIIDFNNLLEENNPVKSQNDPEWLRTKITYMRALRELGQMAGLDAGQTEGFFATKKSKAALVMTKDAYSVIRDKLVNDIIRNELELSAYDPQGIVDARFEKMFAGDEKKTDGKKAAANGYKWK